MPGTSMTGASPSVTVTVKPSDAWLPASSVAVQVTVVAPTLKLDPEEGAHETVGSESTVSVAVGSVQVTISPGDPVSGTEMSAGTLPSVGAVVSCTVTVKLSEAVCEAESVTEQLTVVTPSGKSSPVSPQTPQSGVGSGSSSASSAVTE